MSSFPTIPSGDGVGDGDRILSSECAQSVIVQLSNGLHTLGLFLTAKNLEKAPNEGKELMSQSKSLPFWLRDLSPFT